MFAVVLFKLVLILVFFETGDAWACEEKSALTHSWTTQRFLLRFDAKPVI